MRHVPQVVQAVTVPRRIASLEPACHLAQQQVLAHVRHVEAENVEDKPLKLLVVVELSLSPPRGPGLAPHVERP